jgi:hypothetical protein
MTITPGHSTIAKTEPRRLRSLLLVTLAGMLLAGCAANQPPSDEYLTTHGYWYHDGNHQDGPSESASPQAKYNALHGTWLWPPAEIDIPD